MRAPGIQNSQGGTQITTSTTPFPHEMYKKETEAIEKFKYSQFGAWLSGNALVSCRVGLAGTRYESLTEIVVRSSTGRVRWLMGLAQNAGGGGGGVGEEKEKEEGKKEFKTEMKQECIVIPSSVFEGMREAENLITSFDKEKLEHEQRQEKIKDAAATFPPKKRSGKIQLLRARDSIKPPSSPPRKFRQTRSKMEGMLEGMSEMILDETAVEAEEVEKSKSKSDEAGGSSGSGERRNSFSDYSPPITAIETFVGQEMKDLIEIKNWLSGVFFPEGPGATKKTNDSNDDVTKTVADILLEDFGYTR